MHNKSCEFSLGQQEGCSLGDSTSDTASRNCSRDGGEDSMYVILTVGDYIQSSTYFFVESFC